MQLTITNDTSILYLISSLHTYVNADCIDVIISSTYWSFEMHPKSVHWIKWMKWKNHTNEKCQSNTKIGTLKYKNTKVPIKIYDAENDVFCYNLSKITFMFSFVFKTHYVNFHMTYDIIWLGISTTLTLPYIYIYIYIFFMDPTEFGRSHTVSSCDIMIILHRALNK